MNRINLLDIKTTNKIAAGEVVEGPFSIVKELIENSIDAKSKNIVVEIKEGGQKSIRITDDGHGIHPEDISKAFTSHATSKISCIEDIYAITSMGFRGEALASISSVSNTILKSRIKDFTFGKEIYITGGNINYIKDIGCNIGTIVEVNDLFFNVPARKKFLKSSRRDSTLISNIINKLALANSNIAFKFLNNDKNSLTTYGTGKIKDVIRNVYGKKIYDNTIYFEEHMDIASIYGYIGTEEISRKSRNNQSIFINKRYIKNKLITAAVENAFKSFLTINNHPFFVLFLDIFPELIDINVHPSKSEIKFKNERTIFKLVFDTVHQTIRNNLKNHFNVSFENIENETINTNENKTTSMDFKNNQIKETEERIKYKIPIQIPIDLNSKQNEYIPTINNDFNKLSSLKDSNTNKENKLENTNNYLNAQKKHAKFDKLNIIGQFNNTYILAENLGTLYIIDQHAAHEKILFEKYRNNINNNEVTIQILISPIVIELSPENFLIYEENLNVFKTSGFNIEIFGKNTICIKEVPIILGKPNIENLFMDILYNLKNMGTGKPSEVKYDTIAKLACKSAVKANDSLSKIEMEGLIEDLRFIKDPFTCPHGRPTIIKITLKELEKKFKRIQ